MGRKVCLRCKGKTLLGFVNKTFENIEISGFRSQRPFSKFSLLSYPWSVVQCGDGPLHVHVYCEAVVITLIIKELPDQGKD